MLSLKGEVLRGKAEVRGPCLAVPVLCSWEAAFLKEAKALNSGFFCVARALECLSPTNSNSNPS